MNNGKIIKLNRGVKTLFIFLLLITLSGCALINTMLKLAPLAAIFVYYSAPTETEDGKILCFKTIRTYKKDKDADINYALNIKNEYYVCEIDCLNGEVRELAQILDDKFYDLDKGIIYPLKDESKIVISLNDPQGTWQMDMDGSDFRKLSTHTIKPKEYILSNKNYAYLPCPQIKDISSD